MHIGKISKMVVMASALAIALFPLLSYRAFAHEVVSLSQYGLKEGDIIRAVGDPDIYIVNVFGYKRLFVSPQIFGFYGHLKWENVREVRADVRDKFLTSAYFRNCETNDPKVYALEVAAEDTGVLRWANLSAERALEEDEEFFEKAFCINSREFNAYGRGAAYTSLAQVPSYARAAAPQELDAITSQLTLPAGFRITRFTVSPIGPARFMAFSPDGILFVTVPSAQGLYASSRAGGAVYALPDRDRDGKADEAKAVLSGLDTRPHGIAFYNGYLYIAEERSVARYPYLGDAKIGARETVVSNLPGGGHVSRTIGFDANGKMYVSVGSSCNACAEEDDRRAAILEYNPDGSGERVFARGLRNAVGFTFHTYTGEIWATDNGRDWLGDDLPPDEIDIVRDGKNYGWPYCYGQRIADLNMGNPSFCPQTEPSVFDIQAHSATIGLRFIESKQFPPDWQTDLLVAYRGSWNRSVPTGYKIARLDVEGNRISFQYDFITGWLKPDGSVLGRPVDVIFDGAGALYISDDKANTIYRVTRS